MVTILPALRQVREDLVHLFNRKAVERLCRASGHAWRRRQLDPYTTLHAFLLQVLHMNTSMSHLSHLTGEPFTASAYCQARQRLPLALLEHLVNCLGDQLLGMSDLARWRGHRVWLSDGSGFSMPDTPALQAHFGQPGNQKPGCGFPVAHMLALLDAETGFVRDVLVHPMRTQDIAHVSELHPKMEEGDVLVGDRGFCSYAHFALISGANLHGVFRMHQKRIVDFRSHRRRACKHDSKGRPRSRWLRRLGICSQRVEWPKPATRPKWMS